MFYIASVAANSWRGYNKTTQVMRVLQAKVRFGILIVKNEMWSLDSQQYLYLIWDATRELITGLSTLYWDIQGQSKPGPLGWQVHIQMHIADLESYQLGLSVFFACTRNVKFLVSSRWSLKWGTDLSKHPTVPTLHHVESEIWILRASDFSEHPTIPDFLHRVVLFTAHWKQQ